MNNNVIREKEFIDYYDGFKEKKTILPNGNEYDFLLERNNNHMNDTALSFMNKRITYEELHERIDEYARALYKRGVRQGDTIGICVANTPESVYLIYALNKLGAIIVGLSPLNNEYKMRRDIELTNPKMIIAIDMMYPVLKNTVNELNIDTILFSPLNSCENKLVKLIYNSKQFISGNRFLDKNKNLERIYQSNKDNTETVYPIHENGKCTNIMFTGGSSGVHKGVKLDGNGLNSVVKALDNVLLLEPGMVHLGNIPFGHMCFGRLVLHYSLCKNLEYALTLKAMPNDFLDELIRTNANGAMGGPIHWEALIENPKLKKNSLGELIQPLSGGEMFKPKKQEQANMALKYAGCKYEIGNGLGLTEMWAPTHVCVGGINTSGTIGFPIPFVDAKIVDPNTFEDVEDLETGLLLVKGPGMMLGYLNNEEETKEAFYYDANGDKWYNTKDLAKKMPNGEYVYIGRKKRNFVSNVDNIYPEQIEQLLLQIPEIREVVVTPIPDEFEQFLPKYNISLYNFECDKSMLEYRINQIIKNTLGDSALPGYIEYYAEPLPRTDNGKLDTNLLCNNDLEQFNNNKIVRTRYR